MAGTAGGRRPGGGAEWRHSRRSDRRPELPGLASPYRQGMGPARRPVSLPCLVRP